MRLVLATLAFALPAAGCSLLYNPNNIDKAPIDSPAPDMEIIPDADPNSLVLDPDQSIVLTEGQGIEGSRKALLVLHGEQLVEGATIELTDPATGLAHPSITLDTDPPFVAGNHKMIAIPVTVAIDANDADVALDVKVTQQANGAPLSKSLTGVVTLRGLPTLEGGANVAIPAGRTTFSKIAVTSLAITGTTPISLRSTSSLSITGTTSVSASTTGPGPGGGSGGPGGGITTMGGTGTGTCPGTGGAASTVGPGSPGNPGKLRTGCNSDEGISDLSVNVSGGGGGGGGGTLNTGRTGGAGGGAIVLTADGDLAVGPVTADGSAGPTSGGTVGGPGTGGVIILRSNGAFAAGMVSAQGGAGGDGGRIRVDNPAGTVAVTATPSGVYRGPMFAADTALVVTTPTPTLTITGQPNTSVKLYIDGQDNDYLPASKVVTNIGIPTQGSSALPLTGANSLYRGLNTLCLEVAGATVARNEARNCITLVYVMQQGQ